MQTEKIAVHLNGHITKNGRLEVELPDSLPRDVDVELMLRLVKREGTEEELDDYVPLHFQAHTAGGILESGLFGVWADLGIEIEDSAAWVEDVRRRIEKREL